MAARHVRSKVVFRKEVEAELFGPSLVEAVPDSDAVWSLKPLVEELFGPEMRSRCTASGGVPYDPVSLLSVVVFGLFEGVHSTRMLEKACRFDVRYWVLTGRLAPDHNTLHRFISGLAEELPWMMQRLLSHAREQGLVKLRVVAVDGSKVAADVSHWRSATRDILASIPEEERPVPLRSARGQGLCGFNVQAAVDTETGILVGEAVLRSPSDAHAMPEVMQSVEACAGQVPELVVADAGYDSGETHTLLASKGVEGVVVPQNKDALFWSLDKDGLPVCPMGQSPVAQSGYVRYGRKTVRYRVRGCRSCALNALCKAGTGKSIFVPEGTDPADRIRNAQRLQLPQYQEIAKSRGPTVELVFARIRGKLRGNRFSTRSKRKVQAEFRLFCLSENIRLVLKALFDLLEAFWAAIWPVRRLALGHARLHLQGMLSRTTQ
jgi:transposase